jgi:hypothetical protein
MLGPAVTAITLVYAEKVKFIAFTFPAPHHAPVHIAFRPGVHRALRWKLATERGIDMAERGGRYGTVPAAWMGMAVVLLALVPAAMRVADGQAGWLEALFILAGAGFITFHATRLVLLHRAGREEDDGGPR